MKLRVAMMGRGYDEMVRWPSELEVPADASLKEALHALTDLLPAGQQLSASCLVVHNGTHLGTVSTHENARLADQDELLLIAPVAGG